MVSDVELLGLVERGLFKDAATKIDHEKAPSLGLQVIRADLEIDVGTTSRAGELAEFLLNDRLSHAERAKCWEIIGRIALSAGQIEHGLRAMHRAFASIALSQDRRKEARLIAVNCEALLHWRGIIEPAAAELPRLRQAAVSTGDPYSLIAFHSLLAQIKAKKGLLSGAKRSLETSQSLLEQWPSLWYQGRVAIIRAAIHSLESDYPAALAATEMAIDCAKKSGSRRLLGPALGNLAHIKLAQGKFAEANQAIAQFLSKIDKGGSAEIAGYDTSLQIALSMRDLELSRTLADAANAISAGVDEGASYHGLWYLLTRTRWLYRTGNIDTGLTLALDSIPKAERMADENLLVRFKLLAAEGLGRANRNLEASALLCETISRNDLSLEVLADSMRISGLLRANQDPAAAAVNYQRAVIIFDAIGNISARNDSAREASESLSCAGASKIAAGTVELSRSSAQLRNPESLPNPAILIEKTSALMEFGSVPPLLAREAVSLLAASGMVLEASAIATNANGHVETLVVFPEGSGRARKPSTDAIRIDVGTHQHRKFELLAVPLPTASARVSLLSVERLIERAIALARAHQVERELSALWPEQTTERQLGLICASQRMLDLVKTIRRVAASNVNVLLTGETGVGKELFARALHLASPRSDRTFLPFNCATVPRDLFDSQLFGHRRGSFTGAMDDAAGVIRGASGGTLFLDEIGEMTLETQPKLLRFLESGEILPIGDTKPQNVDVRVVAATNAKLDQYVADGRFREDLYYRLNVVRIDIPPLRERREEIPALVEYFLERFAHELQKPMLRVTDETLEYLVLHRWPGNVRQLANEIRRIVAMAEPGAVVMPAHLSDDIVAGRRTISTDSTPRKAAEVITRIDQPLAAAVEHIERAAIQRTLALCEGRLDEAAKLLGLSRKGLYLKRQRLHLD